jgi:hypothetical protein
MDWMAFLVYMTRALAWPITAVVLLYWFRSHLTDFVQAAGRFIRERQFKIAGPGISFEAAGAVEEEKLLSLPQPIPPAPAPSPGSKIPDRIEAREFILRDEAGRVRARIAMAEHAGAPGFILYDSHGTARVHIAISEEQGELGFALCDSQGTARVALVIDQHTDSSGLLIETANNLIALAETPEHGPSLRLLRKAKEKAKAILKPDYLSLNDRVFLLVDDASAISALMVRDSKGRIRLFSPGKSLETGEFSQDRGL